MEKFSFSELKIAKVKLFTQSLTKFYCISIKTIFNISFFAAWLLTKKHAVVDLFIFEKKREIKKIELSKDYLENIKPWLIFGVLPYDFR